MCMATGVKPRCTDQCVYLYPWQTTTIPRREIQICEDSGAAMAQLNAPVEVGAAKFLNITVPLRGAILRDGEKCASERQVDNGELRIR